MDDYEHDMQELQYQIKFLKDKIRDIDNDISLSNAQDVDKRKELMKEREMMEKILDNLEYLEHLMDSCPAREE